MISFIFLPLKTQKTPQNEQTNVDAFMKLPVPGSVVNQQTLGSCSEVYHQQQWRNNHGFSSKVKGWVNQLWQKDWSQIIITVAPVLMFRWETKNKSNGPQQLCTYCACLCCFSFPQSTDRIWMDHVISWSWMETAPHRGREAKVIKLDDYFQQQCKDKWKEGVTQQILISKSVQK